MLRNAKRLRHCMLRWRQLRSRRWLGRHTIKLLLPVNKEYCRCCRLSVFLSCMPDLVFSCARALGQRHRRTRWETWSGPCLRLSSGPKMSLRESWRLTLSKIPIPTNLCRTTSKPASYSTCAARSRSDSKLCYDTSLLARSGNVCDELRVQILFCCPRFPLGRIFLPLFFFGTFSFALRNFFRDVLLPKID